METIRYSDQVAAEVRAAIARKGLGMSVVAHEADIAVSTLSRKLRGIGVFSVDELARIAGVLSVETPSLLPQARTARAA